MANPTRLRWSVRTEYTDGSPFGAEDLAGFLIQVDDAPAVNVPMEWNDENQYEFPLSDLSLGYGEHVARVATVARNGQTSDFSEPHVFEIVDERVPHPPFDVRAVA